MPSRDALEYTDKHELYILRPPKVPQGTLNCPKVPQASLMVLQGDL